MRKFEIRNRWNDSVIYAGKHESLADAVVAAKANLVGANLVGANLRGANLGGASLGGANLGGASLGDANLGSANLRGANLGDADLGDANLGDVNLGSANLRGANLVGANLRGANLGGASLLDANLGSANLRGANLGGADLGEKNTAFFRDDIIEILSHAVAEISALLEKMRAGEIDGRVYEGPCACLVGTIANAQGCCYKNLNGIQPDGGRPAEQWFLQFKPGQTPENYEPMKRTIDWIEAYSASLTPSK